VSARIRDVADPNATLGRASVENALAIERGQG
jgi:hypothetical protein